MGEPAVPGLDTSVPNVARVYDALLGGKDNFAADRAQAAKLVEFDPSLPVLVRQNRAFITRVVLWAAGKGIRQFLDLGSGLPTHPAVHEAAQTVIDSPRVVYIDNDPVAALHARSLLADTDGVLAVRADLTEPEAIMSGDLIDRAVPVCVLLAAVLHFMTAEDSRVLVGRYVRLLAPGSVLAVSVIGSDDPAVATAARQAYTATRSYTHTRDDVASFLVEAGLELVRPGVVMAHEWRSDTHDLGRPPGGTLRVLAAVGRVVGA